jgi:hypothetical protein
MTFDDWWDSTKAKATPETFAGWERSCREAWDAAVAAERERIAALLDAEHEKRKHLDNHAAFYARMIREQR